MTAYLIPKNLGPKIGAALCILALATMAWLQPAKGSSEFPDILQERQIEEFNKKPPALVRVEDNGGGVVVEFERLADRYRRGNVRVEIGGECKSACTLFTAVPTACVMKGAELWFHAPFTMPQNGVRQFDVQSTEHLFSWYPKGVQKWITKHGGLTPDWIVLKGKELTELVPSCAKKLP